MTAVDHAELKRAAEGATPGPWNNSGRSVDDFDAECMMRMEWIANGAADDDDDLNANVENDAAFIAAANPAVVLALLSEIEGLKAAKWEVRHVDTMNDVVSMGMARDDAIARADEAERQLDALRTQAPDSWRPSLMDMARAIYDAPTRFDGDAVGTHLGRSEMVDCSARTAEEEREIVLCMCEDAASAILALRPQTAESGK